MSNYRVMNDMFGYPCEYQVKALHEKHGIPQIELYKDVKIMYTLSNYDVLKDYWGANDSIQESVSILFNLGYGKVEKLPEDIAKLYNNITSKKKLEDLRNMMFDDLKSNYCQIHGKYSFSSYENYCVISSGSSPKICLESLSKNIKEDIDKILLYKEQLKGLEI